MIKALEDVVPFVHSHYPESTVWKEGVLENWLTIAAMNGYLMLALNDEEEPVGLIIARTVDKIPAKMDRNPFDEDGQIIYVDFAIAPNKQVLSALAWAVLQRYGLRKILAYRKNAHQPETSPLDDIRVHDTGKVAKALLKIEQ